MELLLSLHKREQPTPKRNVCWRLGAVWQPVVVLHVCLDGNYNYQQTADLSPYPKATPTLILLSERARPKT